MTEKSLAPTLLLAMPQMEDPNFSRSVVLLCRHESEGAMGLVINRPTDTLVSSLVEFDPPPQHDNRMIVWAGGPVEPQRGWLVLGFDPGTGEAIEVAPGIYLSASQDLLRTLLGMNSAQAARSRFLLGYAGWGEHQLESELAASAWLTAEVSTDLVFATPADAMWEAAIRSLGIDPYSLQLGSGVH
jgi:putative transcriptional regulator